MGQHSVPTLSIRYENSYGELIGKEGEGFIYVLRLMNDARLLVGVECVGLCETAYRKALEHAEERTTMGKKIRNRL